MEMYNYDMHFSYSELIEAFLFHLELDNFLTELDIDYS